MSATQYKRVVLEGPVRNRQDGTFYIGDGDRFIDANLIDASAKHVVKVEDIPAPVDDRVGDIVRSARGSVLQVVGVNPLRHIMLVPAPGTPGRFGEIFGPVSEPRVLLVRDNKVVGK